MCLTQQRAKRREGARSLVRKQFQLWATISAATHGACAPGRAHRERRRIACTYEHERPWRLPRRALARCGENPHRLERVRPPAEREQRPSAHPQGVRAERRREWRAPHHLGVQARVRKRSHAATHALITAGVADVDATLAPVFDSVHRRTPGLAQRVARAPHGVHALGHIHSESCIERISVSRAAEGFERARGVAQRTEHHAELAQCGHEARRLSHGCTQPRQAVAISPGAVQLGAQVHIREEHGVIVAQREPPQLAGSHAVAGVERFVCGDHAARSIGRHRGCAAQRASAAASRRCVERVLSDSK